MGVYWIHPMSVRPSVRPKAARQFAADDILLYEFCYYNPMDLLHHLGKIKKNRYHCNTILSFLISRHYKKSLLRSQIYHGYEELSTDTNYPIWWTQERRSKYTVQLASWQLRSNSPKTSIRPSVDKVSETLWKNCWLNSFHTWHLTLWGESLDPYSFSCL